MKFTSHVKPLKQNLFENFSIDSLLLTLFGIVAYV